jgi:hypothetical protein
VACLGLADGGARPHPSSQVPLAQRERHRVGTSLPNRVESRRLLGEGPSKKAGERRPPIEGQWEKVSHRRLRGEGLPAKAGGRRPSGEGRREKVYEQRPVGEGLLEKARVEKVP